eukprot:6060489-Amphidinium_carterae.1
MFVFAMVFGGARIGLVRLQAGIEYRRFPFKDSLEKQRTRLLGHDMGFVIEMAYLGCMHSKLGKETLESQTLDIMPDEGKHVSAEDALQGLKRLSSTPLWKFVDDGSTGECDTVRQWVSDIADGRPPKSKLGNTSFLASAWARLQYFATYERTEKVTESDGKSKAKSKSYFGTAALELLLADLKKKKEEEVTTDLLKPL